MYDNVDLTLGKEHCPGIDFLKSIPSYLTVVSNQGVNNFGEYVIGYLESLKVSITTKRVRIFNSSICKYLLGDNFKTMTLTDTRHAIQKISDCLHIPVRLANVTRIDLAKNIIMQFDERLYYRYLGEAQYYNRLEQNNGLYYSNLSRQLVFYGKEHEQQIKGRPIPKLYEDRNTLRYEIRWKKHLQQQLHRPEIIAENLTEEGFYGSLVTRWRDEYLAIQKLKSKLTDMKPTGSKKELFENLALITILELGQPEVLNKVREWQLTGKISKKQAFDLRSAIRSLSTVPTNDHGNDLIDELTRKVKEAARCW